MTEGVKPKKFTTEYTDKKNFIFFESSVNSVLTSSPKENKGTERGEKQLSRNSLIFKSFLCVLCG